MEGNNNNNNALNKEQEEALSKFPPEIREILQDPMMKEVLKAIAKNNQLYFKVMEKPESPEAKKLLILEKAGFIKPPKHNFAVLLKQKEVQEVIEAIKKDPSQYDV